MDFSLVKRDEASSREVGGLDNAGGMLFGYLLYIVASY
jgi:hypothetical protein